MTVFIDDFDRANGALGGNWSVLLSAASIVNGTVQGTGHWHAIDTTVSTNGRMEAAIHFLWGGLNSYYCRVLLKSTGADPNSFSIGFTSATNPPTLVIRNGSNSLATVLATTTLANAIGPYVELRGVWDNGHISAYVNGVLTLEVDSSLWSDGLYAGMTGYATTSNPLDFMALDGDSPTLEASPAVIGNYGGCTSITLTGANTSWTPGTPGAPTFTVNHGTITAQTVNSATSATITYCPGSYLGAVTITDPTTGTSTAIIVTSDPGTVPIEGAGLTPEVAEYLQRSAVAETNSTIINRNEEINVYSGTHTISETITTINNHLDDPTPPNGSGGTALGYIIQAFDLLNGGNNWGGAATVFGNTTLIKADTGTTLERLDLAQSGGSFAVGTLARALAGFPGGTHQDILDAVAGISAPDMQEIIDLLLAIQGGEDASIKLNELILRDIQTLNGYTLGDILTAIAAIPTAEPTDLTPVLTAISNLSSQLSSTRTDILNAIAGLGIVLTALQFTVGTIDTTVGGIALVTDDILEIVTGLQSAAAQPTPPIWPGLASVTLGTPVALVDGVQIDAIMDGLIVEITDQPSSAGKYQFGTVTSWKYAGAVMFQSDRGDWERAESFGVDTQLLVPRTMTQASAAILRVGSGYAGIVRPWTRSL